MVVPKINDYSAPEVGARGGNFQSSASLAQTGAYGQQLQRAGAEVSSFESAVYRQREMEETSDLNARFSEENAQLTEDIRNQTQDGTVDAQQIQENVKKRIDSLNKDISTGGGRRAFERNAAQLASSTSRMAAQGQAIVKGAKATANVKSQLDNNSSALINDPSQFGALYEGTMASIDDQVGSFGLPAADGEKLKRAAGAELAKSAVRGWANLNPDLAQKKLNDGEYDKYFDGDVKAQMQGYINQQQSAREIEGRRREKAQEDALKKRTEKWQSDNLNSLVKGELPTQSIIDAPIKYDDKVAMLKLQDWASRERTQVDRSLENELFRRINLPEGDPQQIQDITQLVPYVGRGLTPEAIEKLNGWIDKSPAGEAAKANRKAIFDYATARLVKKDAFGMSDPKGEAALAQFRQDLQEQEAQFRKEGKPLSDLYNPHSKDYFGLQADRYKRSQKDIMRDTVQEMRRASTKNQVDFKPKQEALVPRKEGESPADWLKRRRGG